MRGSIPHLPRLPPLQRVPPSSRAPVCGVPRDRWSRRARDGTARTAGVALALAGMLHGHAITDGPVALLLPRRTCAGGEWSERRLRAEAGNGTPVTGVHGRQAVTQESAQSSTASPSCSDSEGKPPQERAPALLTAPHRCGRASGPGGVPPPARSARAPHDPAAG